MTGQLAPAMRLLTLQADALPGTVRAGRSAVQLVVATRDRGSRGRIALTCWGALRPQLTQRRAAARSKARPVARAPPANAICRRTSWRTGPGSRARCGDNAGLDDPAPLVDDAHSSLRSPSRRPRTAHQSSPSLPHRPGWHGSARGNPGGCLLMAL